MRKMKSYCQDNNLLTIKDILHNMTIVITVVILSKRKKNAFYF